LGLLLAACGVVQRAAEASAPASGDANLITRAEIGRGQWVESRAPDSILNPGEVQVYVDGVRLGGVGRLRAMPTR
jgi:hypothetical protein